VPLPDQRALLRVARAVSIQSPLHVVEDVGAPVEQLAQHTLLVVAHEAREPGCGVE